MPPELRGLRILVVEDNFLVADQTRDVLQECGCEVVGPVPRLAQAIGLASAASLDGALLDINLAGEYCFPLAALLQQRGVPFVFLTGYEDGALIPRDFKDVPRLAKPFDRQQVVEAAALHLALR